MDIPRSPNSEPLDERVRGRSHRGIVSLIPSATEILYALGAGPHVIGVSHECDYPPEVCSKPRLTRCRIDTTATSYAIDQSTRTLLAGGEPLYELDHELLGDLAPDLIVTQAQCDVCAVRYEDVLEAVHGEASLRSTRVVSLNPQSLDDVLHDVSRVGKACGQLAAAQQLVAEMQVRIQRVRQATSDIAESRLRTACIEWIEPVMVAGNWVPELVELAGGTIELAEAQEPSVWVQWDDLLHFDPQVMIVMPCGFDLQRSYNEIQHLAARPGWYDISAVREQRVYAVDANAYFNRSGPRIVDSLEILLSLLHPQRARGASVPSHSHAWRRYK